MNCDERLWNTFVGRVSFSFGPTFWRECSSIVEYMMRLVETMEFSFFIPLA
jgi:hypothetical protein